jgi:hypothetical protein
MYSNNDMNAYLERILTIINSEIPKETLEKSMDNVHCKGLFSLVINGTEDGKLTRVFIAHKKIKLGQVQFHTHRYDLNLTVLKGEFMHHTATLCDPLDMSIEMDSFTYQSPLNGGVGLSGGGLTSKELKSYMMPIGSTVYIDHEELHTVSVNKGCIWVVEELGFKTKISQVWGVPFTVDGLYNPPKQYQINDNHQLVKKTINEIASHYKMVNK